MCALECFVFPEVQIQGSVCIYEASIPPMATLDAFEVFWDKISHLWPCWPRTPCLCWVMQSYAGAIEPSWEVWWQKTFGDILLTATSCWLEQLFFRFMKYSPSYRSNVKIKLDNVPKHPSFCPWVPAACNAAWRVSLAKVNPRLHLQFLDDFKKNIRVGWQNPTRMAISQNINNLWFLEDSKIFLLHTPL